MRVLSLSTLYPNDQTPNFGIFVERQMQAVAARGDVDLVMVNPIGLPPFPISLHPRYRALRSLPSIEQRGAVQVLRPRFRLLPRIGGRFNAAAEARAVLPLAQRLHAEAPFDLIDAQFFYPDGPAAVSLAKALGLPCSIKARGADIHHWGTSSGTSDQVRRAAQDATALLAVSGGLADDIAALGVPRSKVTIHRTGLDRAVFCPRDKAQSRDALGLPHDRPVLACVGALIPRKGQRYAIEALAQLPDAILVLAGTGPDEAELKALADTLELTDRIRFLGSVPHGDLPVVLSAADIFVLPTASEGLANAWVEALACGTPVVTTPIAGARELLTNPAWGEMVARDKLPIAIAISQILADPPSRKTVAAGAAPFSWEKNAEALVDHWRHLAAK
ncbi:glycosyltransferase [Sphingorhabdus sp.]|uniref:glycosyltransferase n=1 Tax=Sphingorhabdus sp. TaxID=1902408 RepID=UPI0032B76E4F